MSRSLFNEVLNGYLSVLSFWAVMSFAMYIWQDRKIGYQNLRPYFAIIGLLLGDCVVRSAFWWVRHVINVGGTPNKPFFYSIALVGAIIQVWGVLCLIRVFVNQNTQRSRNAWIYALTTATVWTFGWLSYGQYMYGNFDWGALF